MRWSFPSNNNGDVNGISNSGIETFQGTPLKSLAREICQNSLDASLDESPVTVDFISFELSKEEIPGAEDLCDAFNRSLAFWEPKKAQDFFNTALEVMNAEKIPFLRISDFNTTGLCGSDGEYNTPWCNLTKSSGASDKAVTSGGSFGIGKYAPFACSSFRTVFYSTLDKDGKSAYQGISRITSFRNDNNEITSGVGYWGGENNAPVFNRQLALDPAYSRPKGKTGTDVYIAGFRKSVDWKSDIVASILDGFLYAIYTGKLVVHVDDITIDNEHLTDLCDDYKEYLTENANNYYEILTTTQSVDIDFKNMGLIRLWIAIRPDRPDMHRKVAMIRKTGMKIMDKGGISGNIPFAGVMLIEGEKINDFLRSLENPQHTKWEPDRCTRGRQYAQNIIRDLISFIKDELEKLKPEDDSDEVDPSVGEYLPDESDGEGADGRQEEEVISNTIKSVEVTISRPKASSGTQAANGKDAEAGDEREEAESNDGTGSGHNGGRGGGTRSGDGDGRGDGKGPHKEGKKKNLVSILPLKARVVCLSKDRGEYSVTFVPSISADNGYIELFMSAETQNYTAPIVHAVGIGQQGIEIENNKVKNIAFTEKKPVRLKVTIAYHDYCSMEVKAYGNKI
mgnify:FL=1